MKINLTIVITLLILLTACTKNSNESEIQIGTITEDQAIETVKTQHEQKFNFGEIEIVSILKKQDEYEIKWERKSNCESGIDYVDKKNGTIARGMHQIC
ncbi:hypothetical protein [Cohnella sp. AR92]|uniref:hypothetical protein n=1 Tax=Cohnella sp. AR92 TaxID=648716 RepID=UPI000F8CCA96|nr:hypothetical protein [Cohnella sp. AR92]RUS43576.1 hypothetical protein ELR57_24930 [Cohnella sp. AR92]